MSSRTRNGIALLLIALIVILSLLHLCWLTRNVSAMTGTLQAAGDAAAAEEFSRSRQLLEEVWAQYQQIEGQLNITINEKQLDEVCTDFARTRQSAVAGDAASYRTELAGLEESIRDLSRSEQLVWGNLF